MDTFPLYEIAKLIPKGHLITFAKEYLDLSDEEIEEMQRKCCVTRGDVHYTVMKAWVDEFPERNTARKLKQISDDLRISHAFRLAINVNQPIVPQLSKLSRKICGTDWMFLSSSLGHDPENSHHILPPEELGHEQLAIRILDTWRGNVAHRGNVAGQFTLIMNNFMSKYNPYMEILTIIREANKGN